MERLDSRGGSDRTPRLLVGAGIVAAGVTLATLGLLGATGVGFTRPIGFSAAAGLSLAVLLVGAGVALDTPSARSGTVSWERSSPAPTHVTDGGAGERDRRGR